MIPTKHTITATAREAIREDLGTRDAILRIVQGALASDLQSRGCVREIADDAVRHERGRTAKWTAERVGKVKDDVLDIIMFERNRAREDLKEAMHRVVEIERRLGITISEAAALAQEKRNAAADRWDSDWTGSDSCSDGRFTYYPPIISNAAEGDKAAARRYWAMEDALVEGKTLKVSRGVDGGFCVKEVDE